MRILDNIISDRGSKYAVSGGPCASEEEAKAFVRTLCGRKKFARATHNTWALLSAGGPPPMTQLVPGIQESTQDSSNLALPQDLQVRLLAELDAVWCGWCGPRGWGGEQWCVGRKVESGMNCMWSW